ncbi:MAG: hypothetical protein PHI98_03005 [Eubacteriales bacterium]|nr:hypothetical protein [Eubacteriales bacterium]
MHASIIHKPAGIRECKADRTFDLVLMVLVVLTLVIVIYPLYFIVLASVSSPQYVNSGTPLL